jgi:hypothetical protein
MKRIIKLQNIEDGHENPYEDKASKLLILIVSVRVAIAILATRLPSERSHFMPQTARLP